MARNMTATLHRRRRRYPLGLWKEADREKHEAVEGKPAAVVQRKPEPLDRADDPICEHTAPVRGSAREQFIAEGRSGPTWSDRRGQGTGAGQRERERRQVRIGE
jgi:hypothetical protein